MVDLLFVGNLYSDEKKPLYLKNSKRGYQFAAQTLQESFLSGLLSNGVNVTVLSQPSLSTFPFGYKMPVIKPGAFNYNGACVGHTIGKLNLPIVGFSFAFKKYIREWYAGSGNNKVVMVYSANPEMMRIALYIKKNYRQIHVCYIIPDLPIYMGVNKLYEKIGLKKRDNNFINKYIRNFDSYVVLTERIAEALSISNRKHVVIEGMFRPVNSSTKSFKPLIGKRVFLYTGGLVGRYGINDLCNAFLKVKNSDAELWLCGKGDAVGAIELFAKRDKRIKYLGIVPHEKVLELQQSASFLVNPRHSGEDFVKYSFPSKTMEYMASGTPTIMCPLECLPENYKEHLLLFEDESVDGMAAKMNDVIAIDADELKIIGQKARQFILDNKTPDKQVKIVLQMIM